MNDYMSITDPAAMHAAVDKNLRDKPFALMVADATVDAVAEATAYAPYNKNLLADDWIKKAVDMAAQDDDSTTGFPPGGAVVVLSNEYSVAAYEGDEGWTRRAHPLSDKREPVTQGSGLCHRCDVNGSVGRIIHDEPVARRPLTVFHIRQVAFIVEFAVCDQCYLELSLKCGPIVQVVSRGAV